MSQSQLFMAAYLTLKPLPTKSISCLENVSWTEVKHILPELKSGERQAAHRKGAVSL